MEGLHDLPLSTDGNGNYSVWEIEKALLKAGAGQDKKTIIAHYNKMLQKHFEGYAPEPSIPLSKDRIKTLICEAYSGGLNRGLSGLQDYDLPNELKKHGLMEV